MKTTELQSAYQETREAIIGFVNARLQDNSRITGWRFEWEREWDFGMNILGMDVTFFCGVQFSHSNGGAVTWHVRDSRCFEEYSRFGVPVETFDPKDVMQALHAIGVFVPKK